MDTFAPVLGDEFFQAWFDFYRRRICKALKNHAHVWKRAVNAVNGNMGELLGQLYVDKHYQEAARTRMETMIANLKEAYANPSSILTGWVKKPKQQALEKLSKFTPKIGYPDKWRDYSSMEIYRRRPGRQCQKRCRVRIHTATSTSWTARWIRTSGS